MGLLVPTFEPDEGEVDECRQFALERQNGRSTEEDDLVFAGLVADLTSSRPDATATNFPAPWVAVDSGASLDHDFWDDWLIARVTTMCLSEEAHDDTTVPRFVFVILTMLVAVLSLASLLS